MNNETSKGLSMEQVNELSVKLKIVDGVGACACVMHSAAGKTPLKHIGLNQLVLGFTSSCDNPNQVEQLARQLKALSLLVENSLALANIDRQLGG